MARSRFSSFQKNPYIGHIIPDTEVESKPTENNGIALCKLHHAAFDSFIIGVSP